jgi:hypothetical protein
MPRQQVFLSASSFWARGRCLCRLRGALTGAHTEALP